MRLRVSALAVPADTEVRVAEVDGVSDDARGSAFGILMFESDSGPRPSGDPEARALAHAIGMEALGEVFSDRELFERRRFAARPGQVLTLLGTGGAPAIVLLGCGKPDGPVTSRIREAAAAFMRAAGSSGLGVLLLEPEVAQLVGADDEAPAEAQARAAQALAEGALLGSYRFEVHKSGEPKHTLEHLVVAGIGLDPSALDGGTRRGLAIGSAVWAARDLVNEPPSFMTPTRLAETAVAMAAGAERTSVEIWEPDRIAQERLGGLMGVARGSAEPARLVIVRYEPSPREEAGVDTPHVVLVGKGITFDSGGLSLKSPEGMVTMKTDMSGAAAVVAAACACAALGVKARVTAIAPVTENMPGGRATKPGDVLETRDGQTIEVLNTDAEGRLVLADALCLASEMQPDAIVDLATLTGASVVALGGRIAGLFVNDEALSGRIQAASSRTGEALWRMPLAEEYRKHIDSEVADMKNVGKAGQAGAIAAALLLERFVHGLPWAHIDMAGPARSEDDEGILSKGGTGFGVRTLLELLDSF